MGNTQTAPSGDTKNPVKSNKSPGKVKGLMKIRGKNKSKHQDTPTFADIRSERNEILITTEHETPKSFGKSEEKLLNESYQSPRNLTVESPKTTTESWYSTEECINNVSKIATPSSVVSSESNFMDAAQDFSELIDEINRRCQIVEIHHQNNNNENFQSDLTTLNSFKLNEHRVKYEEEKKKKLNKLGISKTSLISLSENDPCECFETGEVEVVRKFDGDDDNENWKMSIQDENRTKIVKRMSESNLKSSGLPDFKRHMSVPEDVTNQSTSSSTATTAETGVLKRITSLSLNRADLDTKITKPKFVPEKLDFQLYEKFEGYMLINWYVSEIDENHPLGKLLTETEIKLLAAQFCTHLLAAGVLKQIKDKNVLMYNVFKPDCMYYWTYAELPASVPQTPGRISMVSWPPTSPSPSESHKSIPSNTIISSTPRTPDEHLERQEESPENEIKSPQLLFRKNEFRSSARDVELLSLEDEIKRLKQEVEKYKTLVEIQTLTANAVKDFSSPIDETKTIHSSLICDKSDINSSDNKNKNVETSNGVQIKTQTENSKNVSCQTESSEKINAEAQTSPRDVKNGGTSPVACYPESQTPELGEKTSPKIPQSPPLCSSGAPLIPPPMPGLFYPPPPPPMMISTVVPLLPSPVPGLVHPPPPPPMMGLSMSGPPRPPPPPPMMGLSMSGPPQPPPPPPMIGLSMSGPPRPPPPPPTMGLSMSGPPEPPPPPSMMGPGGTLPPPMPGAGGTGQPPPPPMPTSGIPPPPPPSLDKGPCPLPTPPPGGWSAQKAALRKNPMNPKAPMKPLYWTRIIAPVTAETDDSNSASGTALWNEIDELSTDALDEFSELFSRQIIAKKAPSIKKIEEKTKVEAVKLLDSKRSQNVGILAQSLHVDFQEIENAIYNFDTSVVSLEALQQIYEARGTLEELSLIREHLTIKPDIPLDKPEIFLHELSEISNFAERISCLMFMVEFEDSINTISHTLTNIKTTCEFLMSNNELKKVMAIILTLGNYMNGGNVTRGQADGFGLEILGKLKDVKSKDSKITLLHYIVRMYLKSIENPFNTNLPVPQPEDIRRAASVNFDDVKIDLQKLQKQLEGCELKTQKVIENSNEETLQPFKDKMTSFLEHSKKQLSQEHENLEECRSKFVQTMKFYLFKPKNGSLETFPPNSFFELWLSFCIDFKDILKKEIIRIEAERMKELKKKENELKSTVVKTKERPNGLKAKVKRYQEKLS